jgi:hypothetical protein
MAVQKARKVPVYLPSIRKAKGLLTHLQDHNALPETQVAIREGIRRAEKRSA